MNKPSHNADISGGAPTRVVSVSPVVLPAPGRAVDLQLRVSAPVTGSALPIILLSHGHGRSNNLSSLNGYGPLANYWAARGFVVIQPTHLDSTTLRLDPDGPEGALFWRSRAEDMRRLLDQLEAIEAAVPEIAGRLDRGRVAAVGHSLGGHTVAMLAGMRVIDPKNGEEVNLVEPRLKARVLIGAPGNGADTAAFVTEHYPVLHNTNFADMKLPALVVAGDKDQNPDFSARADWRTDAYFLSPGPKSLLTIFGGEHILGGISGYDAAETTDENPERVALVAQLTWAYLRTALYPEDTSWPAASQALLAAATPLGRIESKGEGQIAADAQTKDSLALPVPA
ncbi:alpha/beta hydrolase family protein [Hymenobacter caeli]|uniref:Dienelactone hydrolase n=1 Tax=Hymenobacter caeli TaxID=2735894 RepID=A0ABX2FVB0_9BACT|nr:alpha/beta fold hydrolase [Hymenobacter caeli]NRT21143.1 putative dienelactone hydrolase [Hymenobacter caeli]